MLEKLNKQYEEAIARMDAAEKFSQKWFQAKAEVEDLSNQIWREEQRANHQPGPTDEQLAAAEWVLEGNYDDC